MELAIMIAHECTEIKKRLTSQLKLELEQSTAYKANPEVVTIATLKNIDQAIGRSYSEIYEEIEVIRKLSKALTKRYLLLTDERASALAEGKIEDAWGDWLAFLDVQKSNLKNIRSMIKVR